jgi:hypothetical protein
MIAAVEEEVWLHVKPSDPEMEQYKHGNADKTRTSLAIGRLDNGEQDQNGHPS